MIRFYTLRILKDYIGHIILIGLPAIMISVMISITKNTVPQEVYDDHVIYLALVYIIMFQWFGTAYTFEGIENDFFTSFKQRLMVSSVSPITFLLANTITSILVTFLQSILILVYVLVSYSVTLHNLFFIIITLFLGILMAQTFAVFIILLTKKASVSQAIMTVFVIISMMIGGFFFPFKETALTVFLHRFSSPISWVHYTINGYMNNDYVHVSIGMTLIIIIISISLFGVYQLVNRRVVL